MKLRDIIGVSVFCVLNILQPVHLFTPLYGTTNIQEKEKEKKEKKCAFDVDMDSPGKVDDKLNKLYPGLFHNISIIETVSPEFELGDVGVVIKQHKLKWKKPKRVKRQTSGACCQTDFLATVPVKVMYNNQEYKVVHGEHSYQIVFTGFCGSQPGGSTCFTELVYKWVLIEDENLDSDPPFRFIPVRFNGFCTCYNIG